MTRKLASPQALASLLSGGVIRYSDPVSFSGLTLVPLFTTLRAPFEYTLLADAVTAGTAAVEEVGGGLVPTLRLVNKGPHPVLLVDGEHLIGVKQNRILNTTILVPERTALDIPVSCVEQRRWSPPQGAARPTSPLLFATGRATKTEAVTASARASGAFVADQAAVWRGVQAKLTEMAVHAPTAAMHAAYEHRAPDLAGYVAHLRPQPGQTGVAAAVNTGILCMDLFDRPDTLAGLWDRLIPSYALEALSRPAAAAVSVRDAEAFLSEAAGAEVTAHQAVGRGTDLRLTGARLVGAALEVDQTIVHLALFRRGAPAPTREGWRIASIQVRRQQAGG